MIGRAAIVLGAVLAAAGSCGAVPHAMPASPAPCLAPPLKGALEVNCGFHCDGYPFQKAIGAHSGVDLKAAAGTPVYAPAAGVVTWAGTNADDLTMVVVRTKRGWTYRLLHLKSYAVRQGDRVFRGEFLGRSGGVKGAHGSGKYTTGAHLHFELSVDDALVDPMPYICPTP